MRTMSSSKHYFSWVVHIKLSTTVGAFITDWADITITWFVSGRDMSATVFDGFVEMTSYPYPEYDSSNYSQVTENVTSPSELSPEEIAAILHFEGVVRVVVSVIFGFISVLGLVGNLSVIIVVMANSSMRSTTNILIIGLATADLVFIVVCVPFTALSYALTSWPFGQIICKIYYYVTYVTAYASVYTLVLMSLDRYMAVVHPIQSMTVRTQRNACLALALSWTVICFANLPTLQLFDVYEYENFDGNRTTCVNPGVFETGNTDARILYGTFFGFGFVLPLTAVCILYGSMVRRLLRRNTATPAQRRSVTSNRSKTPESMRAKRRVTLMIVIVVAIFALCWLPLQVIFMVQYFSSEENAVDDSFVFVCAKIAANCLAYMNSCVNPILYAFLSDNFRKGFRRLIPCVHGSGFTPLRKMEMERTSARYAMRATGMGCGTVGGRVPEGAGLGAESNEGLLLTPVHREVRYNGTKARNEDEGFEDVSNVFARE